MARAFKLTLAALALWLPAAAGSAGEEIRFVPLEIILDSPEPVAAWQFELKDRNESTKIVGVENGDSDAFTRAPYYDRGAVERGDSERIVVADYSLAEESRLPTGRIRVATVHLMIEGEADLELTLVTATTSDGRPIDASISQQLP